MPVDLGKTEENDLSLKKKHLSEAFLLLQQDSW